MIFMNMENSKTNEPHKLILKFLQRLDMPNKSYVYLVNVEPNNLIFLKPYNTDDIFWFSDLNGRVLKIEDKVSLTLVINK